MMDGLTLFAVKTELRALIGGRVDKIQQPELDTLVFTIRAGGSNYRLLLCSHPENGRAQLTNAAFSNPQEAPAFCMLLRKRLHGARVLHVEQPNLDRLLVIEFDARDELGDPVRLTLIIELMGKYSNICFIGEDGTLIDSIKHVGASMSSVRILLPGVQYAFPPSQDKRNPLDVDEGGFYQAIQAPGVLYKLLSRTLFGLSPDCAKQIVAKWAGEDELSAEALSDKEKLAFARYLHNLYGAFANGQFTPTIVYSALGEPAAIYPFEPCAPKEQCKTYAGMSEALNVYYEGRDAAERVRRRSASLQKKLQNGLERCYKKLAVYEQARSQGEDLERLRLYGELLTANAHGIARGMRAAKVQNYYLDPPEEVVIELDERMNPQQNAQRYFKRYQKGKAAKALAVKQCEETRAEIEYLEGQLDNIRKCTTDIELIEIKDELVREGYSKPESKKGAQKRHAPSKPMHLRSSEGYDIYVGRNNAQNDALTLRFAQSEDMWLHTKNIPGSHVIIQSKGGEIPEQTLREAAMLAAYYSRAKASASVPVDYCARKFVKKPSGARPGMVIYSTNRTLFVTPDEEQIKKLEVVD